MIKKLKAFVKSFSHFQSGRSIQFLISLTFTVIAAIGMSVVGLLLFTRFSGINKQTISQDNQKLIEQVDYNLDGYLRSMMRVSDAIYYRTIKNSDVGTTSAADDMTLFYESNREQIVSIALFDRDGNKIDAVPVSQLKEGTDVRSEQWFISALDKIENYHFSHPYVQHIFENSDNKYRWVLSLSRYVELTVNGNITSGVLLTDMNFSAIGQIFSNADLYGSGYVYLMDSDGEIIYHPRQQLVYSDIINEDTKTAASLEDGTQIIKYGGENSIVTVKTVGYTGWKVVGVTPVSDVTKQFSQIQIFALTIVLFSIFLLIFVNITVSSKIADPIKRLEKSVKNLEKGDLSAEIAVGGSYEVRHLGNTIKMMVAQMRELMDNIVKEQEGKRKSELDALQSQINPHFLYNTLDSIVWMIEDERYDGAIKMVTALSRLFRISLSRGNNIITVKDELAHAENYLTIQEIRYKNKFTYSIEADENVLSFACIKLIIQPIIENAIYHGMEFMDGDGEIKVSAYRSGKELCIDVTDNGPGMTQEVADSLLSDVPRDKPKSKGSGIGLKNVNERIKLYFGEKYGLQIISEPDEGTNIRIHLPLKNYSAVAEEDRK